MHQWACRPCLLLYNLGYQQPKAASMAEPYLQHQLSGCQKVRPAAVCSCTHLLLGWAEALQHPLYLFKLPYRVILI